MRTVLAHGVFDLLHFGHIEHLRQAKSFGEILVVSVVADRHLSKRTAIYDQDERMELLRALKVVDKVILCDALGPERIISEIRPDVYVRGADYAERRMPEADLLEKLHIPIRFTISCPPRTTEVIAKVLALHKETSS